MTFTLDDLPECCLYKNILDQPRMLHFHKDAEPAEWWTNGRFLTEEQAAEYIALKSEKVKE